jgi:hypothetical protein
MGTSLHRTIYGLAAGATVWSTLALQAFADDQQPMPGQPIKVTDQALQQKIAVEPVKVEKVQAELPVPGFSKRIRPRWCTSTRRLPVIW